MGIESAIIGGIIAGAGSLGGSAIAAGAAGSAADKQARAAEAGMETQWNMYQQNRSDLGPYRAVGTPALNALMRAMGLGTLTQTNAPESIPNYQERLELADRINKLGDMSQRGNMINRVMAATLLPLYQMKLDRLGGPPGSQYPEYQVVGGTGATSIPGSIPGTSTATGQLTSLYNAMNGNIPDAGGSIPFGMLTQPAEQWTGEIDLTQDPGMQFRLEEGRKMRERSAAARTGTLSGAATKEMERYGQEFGSQEYQNAFGRQLQNYLTRYNVSEADKANLFNRLISIAGLGSGATNVGVQAGQTTAGNISDLQTQLGNAQAAGTVGAGNAWSGLVSGLGSDASNLYLLSKMLSRSSYGYPTTSSGRSDWHMLGE